MEIFFRDLARKLDSERKDWRTDTIILLDNAPYHTCASVLKVYKELNMPICFSGPNSYDASPAELMFSFFKAKDINPNRIALSKK